MVQAGVRSLEAEERMVIDVGVAAIAAVERSNDVVLRAGVDLVRRNEAEHLALAPDDVNVVAEQVGEAHALAAAGLIDVLDASRARRLGDLLEVVLALDMEAQAEELRWSQVRDVDVRRRISPAHIQAIVGALGARHAEARQKLLGLVQARRLQPAEREVGHFDDGHCSSSWLAADAPIITAHAGGGRFRSAQGDAAQLLGGFAPLRGGGAPRGASRKTGGEFLLK